MAYDLTRPLENAVLGTPNPARPGAQLRATHRDDLCIKPALEELI